MINEEAIKLIHEVALEMLSGERDEFDAHEAVESIAEDYAEDTATALDLFYSVVSR